MVIHDERVHFPHGTDRGIGEIDHNELGLLDIGGGETVPTMREMLMQFGNRLSFNLEIKELDAVEPAIAIVNELDLAQRVFISSFIPEAILVARDLAPDIRRGFLVDRLAGRIVGGRSAVKAAALLGCKFFLPHSQDLSASWITAAHAEGMNVIPWTVNQLEEGRRLIDLGVDGLISDRADQFFSYLP